eukprot:g20591.t1
MTKLYNDYHNHGFTILAFPCNQFGKQEPGDAREVLDFARNRYGADFPIFAKIDVQGVHQSPVYAYLLKCFPGDITWNFASAFLISRDGTPKLRLIRHRGRR